MISERPNALNLLRNLGRRIGLRLDCYVGHCDPVKELSLRLFPNSPRKARFAPVTLYRSLVWPFTPHPGFRLLEQGV
jgi:hypothetical protein